MRLPAFPTPVPGETVHSVVARFMRRTAGPAYVKLEALSLLKSAPSALLPRQMAIAAAMPLGHPWCDAPEVIINQHSLVPLHTYFADRYAASIVRSRLRDGLCRNPSAVLAISTSQEASRPYKFCPTCIEEDVGGRGFAVSYREHQPEFVRVCARHGTALRHGCSRCHAARRWVMPGECQCRAPGFVDAVKLGNSNLADRGWRWLSEQSAAIFSAEPKTSLLPILRSAFLARGLLGVRNPNTRIYEALIERFGQEFLIEVGAIASGQQGPARWTARLLNLSRHTNDKIPRILRCLLLTALVADTVNGLIGDKWASNSAQPRFPEGYSGRPTLGRPMLDRNLIVDALKKAGNNLYRAAHALSALPSSLAVDMQRHGIALKLSKTVEERIGPDTLERVRLALCAGQSKVSIMRDYKLSAWSLQLIELERLDLGAMHRAANIDRTRQKYRAEISQYIRRHPEAGRMTAERAHPPAYRWLRRFDLEWLCGQIGKKKPVRTPAAKRVPLDLRDAKFAAQIRETASAELAKTTRPRRMSKTFLLGSVGVRTDRTKQLPQCYEAAKNCSESMNAFECRKIRWAVGEYKTLGQPLSMNRFRRFAGMHPDRLDVHARLVAEEVRRHGIVIDGRCRLFGRSADSETKRAA